MKAEWIKCIEDVGKISWCGVYVGMDWAFTDITHAAIHMRNDGRLLACPNCVEKVIKALCNNNEK